MKKECRPIVIVCAGAACAPLWPAAAHAGTTIQAFADAQYQYNSNVFDLAPGAPVEGTGDLRHSDSYYAYGGIFNIDDKMSLQELKLNATFTQFDYDHFTQLTHTEYRFDGLWKWRLGARLAGQLEVLRTRAMVPFTQLLQTQISVGVQQRELASITYRVLQHWTIEGSGYTSQQQQPLAGAPDLQLNENEVAAGLRYLGGRALTVGLFASYQHGDYSHTNGTVIDPSYGQTTEAVTVSYSTSDRSTINGQAGYTHRISSDNLDTTSGITGSLTWIEKLTGKTTINLGIARNINSYLTTNGSELDTTATLQVTWHPTYRLSVAAGYTYTYSQYPEQGTPPDTNRLDHLQYTTLNIDYEFRSWLGIKPYAAIATRSSNVSSVNFNSTVYGIQVVAGWQNSPMKIFE
jgi:hypothetical protein